MFGAGVSIDRALQLLGEQQENARLAEACRAMAIKVQSGRYLSNALQSYPKIFSQAQIRLIGVGESTGQLSLMLAELASLEERQLEIELKVRGSLTMPLIVCALCLTMVTLAPPLLFRSLFQMLQEQGAQLPWMTRILIGLSEALFHPLAWLLGLACCAAVGWASRVWLSRPSGRRRLALGLDALPVVGALLRRVAVTRFLQSLKSTVSVGLPILQGLPLSAASSDDVLLMDACQLAQEGLTLAQALHTAGYFPATLIQGVAAGEESGSLAGMLDSLANLYRVELEHQLEVMTKSLEPLLLGFVGAIVAFTVIAILMPMLKVMETL
jgi:type II secretory pathway component PulF